MKYPQKLNYSQVGAARGMVIPVAAGLMLSALVAQGASLTWDSDPGTVGAQDGAGNWDGSTASWFDGSTNIAATTSSDNLTIGSANGAAGIIAVSGTVGAPLLANNITFNAASSGTYSLSGGAIQLTGASSVVTVNENVTIDNILMFKNVANFVVASGKTITLSSTATNTTTNTTFAQTLTGGGTVKLTAGTWVSGNGPTVKNGSTTSGGLEIAGTATFTSGAGMQLGQTTNGLITLKESGNYVMTNTGQISVGRTGGTGRLSVQGGTYSETTSNTTQASVLVARQNATGVIDISGGRFEILGNGGANALTTNTGGVVVVNAQATNAASSGTINVTGGVSKIKELRFNGGNLHTDAAASAGSGTLNLSGGELYIGGLVKKFGGTDGAGSIVNVGTGSSTYAINLSGGVLGAQADWSSSLDMNLTNTNGGVTIKAADESDASKNITLSGILSGAGGLTKSGAGTLTLSGTSNAFTGDIVVQAGTLSLASAFVDDAASIYLTSGAMLNLDYSGTDSISKLFIDGVQQSAGLYDSSSFASFITGAGALTVTSAPIPEAASFGLFSGLLIAGTVATRRRRREVDAA